MTAPTHRRWFRYSLRTMFVVMTLCAIGAAFMSLESRRYASEQAAITEIDRPGVSFEFHDRLPASLRRLVGDQRLAIFRTVDRVSFPRDGGHFDAGNGAILTALGVSDEDLANLRPALEALPNLNSLNLSSLEITDAGLTQLHGLRSLRRLDVCGTMVTDEGVATLKLKLPQLVIEK